MGLISSKHFNGFLPQLMQELLEELRCSAFFFFFEGFFFFFYYKQLLGYFCFCVCYHSLLLFCDSLFVFFNVEIIVL